MTAASKNISLRVILLFPFSLLYRLVTKIRNKAFDWHILKSRKFSIPVISIGNITIGGTGKTPHVEYLVDLLKNDYKVAVLSRGYGRKTKGYLLGNKKSTAKELGDEPFQILRKNPEITVAVCEKRVVGVENLLQIKSKPQAILLDDAFQHRHIQAGLSILLVDFNRPIFNDHVLPSGNLRESAYGKKRADILIVSKTPDNLSPIDKRIWEKKLALFPYQQLFFSGFSYGKLIPVFKNTQKQLSIEELSQNNTNVLLITGIANPKHLTEYLAKNNLNFSHLDFPDHYNFKMSDIKNIEERFETLKTENKIIITTEKDAVRLREIDSFSKKIKTEFWYLPITVGIQDGKQTTFDRLIMNYVGKNKRVGKLYS